MHDNDIFMNENHIFMNENDIIMNENIFMYENENLAPNISPQNYSWAVHYSMNRVLIQEYSWGKFSFSCMEISFSRIRISHEDFI